MFESHVLKNHHAIPALTCVVPKLQVHKELTTTK